MVAKTIKKDSETYINTKDLKQILKDRVAFVTGGNNSDSKIKDTYKLAIASVIETLEIYESK